MSEEKARAFILKVKSDREFCNLINEAETTGERLKIAGEAGLEFTEEEYLAVSSELPTWTMDKWLEARRNYDAYETSWLARVQFLLEKNRGLATFKLIY